MAASLKHDGEIVLLCFKKEFTKAKRMLSETRTKFKQPMNPWKVIRKASIAVKNKQNPNEYPPKNQYS